MITHPEPDILEREVKWTLGSIIMSRASGGDRISAELLQILKDDAVKVALNIPSNLENSAVAAGLEKAFVWIITNWKILKEMGIPDHLTCLL